MKKIIIAMITAILVETARQTAKIIAEKINTQNK